MKNLENYFFESFKKNFFNETKKTLKISFENLLELTANQNNLDLSALKETEEIKQWFNYIYNCTYISELPYPNLTQEIMIHSEMDIDIIQATGKQKLKVEFLKQDELQCSYEILARKNSIEWNYQNPFASFQVKLKDQTYRCTLVHPSITENKVPKAFFRAQSKSIIELRKFGLNSSQESFLRELIKQKKNIIVAGSTASGKTSFLRSLCQSFDSTEHIVVIEDTHEIPGPQSSYTHFISKKVAGKTMKDYCEYSLRISPDRILLGEIRSNEVIPFILSMNTGHKGLISTIHANCAVDTLTRLTTLFSLFSEASQSISFNQVMKMICSNIDIVVYLENKEVKEIIEVKGSEKGVPIHTKLNVEDISQEQKHPLSFHQVV